MDSVRYHIRMTKEQDSEFRAAAKRSGLTLASFFKAAATEKVARDKQNMSRE